MIEVDEGKLNQMDRLGLAWCRFNCWEWDEYFGPKPDYFDELPERNLCGDETPYRRFRTKGDYVGPLADKIERLIGSINTSRCWWIFELGKTEEEWARWYYSDQGVKEREELAKGRIYGRRYCQVAQEITEEAAQEIGSQTHL